MSASIIGLDPTECHGFYPRARDGRCHGCGIVGDHPPKLAPHPNDVWVLTDEGGDRTVHDGAPLVRLYPGSSVCRYVPAARFATAEWEAETRGLDSARKVALQCAAEAAGEEARQAYANFAELMEFEIEKRRK